MKRIALLVACFALIALFIAPSVTVAKKLKPIQLVKPQTEGGMPLMQALQARSSSRSFSAEQLPPQVFSNLLWAAFGINRPESGKRTAPSASNRQEIDVYVATADGLYLYDAQAHALKPVLAQDIRAATGYQYFAGEVPLNLIFVADFSRMVMMTDDEKAFYSTAATGSISQNVYLYCASEGLATIVRGLVDRAALAKVMKLRPDQHITFTQSVGYPKK